jgi:hypothetical protein
VNTTRPRTVTVRSAFTSNAGCRGRATGSWVVVIDASAATATAVTSVRWSMAACDGSQSTRVPHTLPAVPPAQRDFAASSSRSKTAPAVEPQRGGAATNERREVSGMGGSAASRES